MNVSKLMKLLETIFPLYFYFPFIFYMLILDYTEAGGDILLRLMILTFAWLIGFAIYNLYFAFFSDKPQWVEDAFAVAGLMVGVAMTVYLWDVLDFGSVIPNLAITGALTGILFLLISPFWNISGHVTFTVLMIGILITVEESWAILLPIIPIMVYNRVYMGRHDLMQSIGGVLLGTIGVVAFYFLQA